MNISPRGSNVLRIAEQQAQDDGLWFVAQYASESYLQHALRHLHAVIEQEPCPICGQSEWEGADAR